MNHLDLEVLRQHRPTLAGMESCRKSAVTIPLLPSGDAESGYEILFEVRSAEVESQPGDICLPGGMAEEGEKPEQTAVRETAEELRIREDQIRILGPMDVLYTGSGLLLYPFAAELLDYGSSFSADEVAEVFQVPLDYFLQTDPEIWHTQMKVMPEEGFPFERIHAGRDYAWRTRREEVLFYQYGKYTIWGLTAKIMRSFAGIAGRCLSQ